MQIFWDALGLNQPHSGIYQYAFNLKRELNLQGVFPVEVALSDYSSKFKFFWSLGVEQKILKKIKLSDEFPIIHGLSNLNIAYIGSKKIRRVITLHDLIPLKSTHSIYDHTFKYLMPYVLSKADAIITVSKSTDHDLATFFPKFYHKAKMIENGFSFNQTPSRKIKSSDKIKALYISRYEIYKNFKMIVPLCEKINNLEFHLITDSKGVAYFKSYKKTLPKNLTIYTQTSEEKKQDLLKSSDILVHLSDYEGYCLPAKEALEIGTPIVYSQTTGMHETFGFLDTSCVKNSVDVEEWSQRIEETVKISHSNEYYHNLNSLLKSKITWRENAEKVKIVYHKLSRRT